MNLYLVRHGLSEGNIANVHQPADSPLSDEGLQQAKAVADRFSHVKIDAFYISPMLRARQTAQVIGKKIGRKPKIVNELAEMMPPEQIIGLSDSDPRAKVVMDEIFAKFHDPQFRHSGTENFWDLKSRAKKFLNQVARLNKDNVLAVTHGLTLRALVGLVIFGDDFDSYQFDKLFHNLKTVNTGVTLCQFTNNKWKLITWNDHSHWVE